MKLWKNGVIHTLTNQSEISNILTDQGLIVGLNVDEKEPYDEVIDLKGYHLYPGFVDAHLHLIGYGQFLNRLYLTHTQDKNLVLNLLKKQNIFELLIVDGYHEYVGVTKYDLDTINNQNPMILRHHDFHAVTVNTVVLKQLNKESSTGILREEDAQAVIRHYAKVSNETLESYLETAIKSLYRFGITGGHSDDLFYFNGYQDTLQAFINVQKRIPFRTHLLVHHEVLDDYIASPYFNHYSDFLELKGIKVFYDGTMSSKTALMWHGYQNETSNGLRTTPNFIEIVQKVRQFGLTLAIHVIGDQGLDELIDILKKYPPKENQKDRIIHAPWVSEYGMNALKSMPVTIDIQPQFLSSDFPEATTIFKQFPPYVFPWKTMLKNGLTLSFSSDAPVETPNPLLGILDATERVAKDGKIYQPEERISRMDTIKGYTIYANAQNNLQNRGTIEIGQVADFSIFTFDLETIESSRLKEPLVEMTVINEHIVYQK
ncbi:amidohydrolase [Acholeplasma manati]|uniref:Amidohydrolase n=1 Tax=Paracholeplasma manati TaxID=591373 RepID=A0ABT2Y3J3_9MOLU|nr:amidohydrolase [Paracholeplasma manati]MCV2231306.1 amidohydrolase [Paracholeplasma manati]